MYLIWSHCFTACFSERKRQDKWLFFFFSPVFFFPPFLMPISISLGKWITDEVLALSPCKQTSEMGQSGKRKVSRPKSLNAFCKTSFIYVVLCYRQLLFSVYGRQVRISKPEHLWLDTFDIHWGPKGRHFQRGRRQDNRIPGFSHHFPCGCSELSTPASQHIARMLYPHPCKPQWELSFSQFSQHTFVSAVTCPDKETVAFLELEYLCDEA